MPRCGMAVPYVQYLAHDARLEAASRNVGLEGWVRTCTLPSARTSHSKQTHSPSLHAPARLQPGSLVLTRHSVKPLLWAVP